MARVTESTICHVCKDRAEGATAIEWDDQWAERPFEVRERRCRTCGRIRKWWWFTFPMPFVAWGLAKYIDKEGKVIA